MSSANRRTAASQRTPRWPGYGSLREVPSADQNKIEEQIRQYDDPERHVALDERWKARGYKHFPDGQCKDWLRDSKPTDQKSQMLRLLKRSGFVELQKA